MKEQRFDGPDGTYAVGGEPKFDDERTVQSARPVVPLAKINAKLRHRRLWFLGGAFTIAMLLGAASAVISAYFKQRDVPSSEVAQLDIPSASVAEEAPPTVAPAVNEIEKQPVNSVTPKRSVNTATRPRLVNRDTDDSLGTSRLSEDDELERIRQAVLIDEWQERRMRRVMRRDRRRNDRYNHRDLSNLNEIFEGRRRP